MNPREPGVYIIRNLLNGAVYVGSSRQAIWQRWNEHRSALNRGRHGNPHLQASWKKCGADAFAWEVVENVVRPEDVLPREQYWLDQYFGGAMGVACYNAYPVVGSPEKMRVSERTRAKMSAAHRGCIVTPEHRAKLAEARRGKRHTEETRRLISEKKKGQRVSDEVLARKSARQKGVYPEKLRAAHEARLRVWPGFVAPDGTEHRNVKNLNTFAARFGLHPGCLSRVHYGTLRHHKGWRALPDSEAAQLATAPKFQTTKLRFAFVAPDGTEYHDIPNLRIFAEQHGLRVSNLYAVHYGEKGHHRGWRKLL